MPGFTLRLPDDVTEKLNALASKLHRSRSYLATKAIADFIARESWQLAEIEAGLEEAQRAKFMRDLIPRSAEKAERSHTDQD